MLNKFRVFFSPYRCFLNIKKLHRALGSDCCLHPTFFSLGSFFLGSFLFLISTPDLKDNIDHKKLDYFHEFLCDVTDIFTRNMLQKIVPIITSTI